MTITEFLLDRIADDERIARLFDDVEPTPVEVYSPESGWFERMPDPARVLAECAAKRAIVEWGVRVTDRAVQYPGDVAYVFAAGLVDRQTQYLAAVYADHPDYDETWKP
jgi:hypothetical protein